MSDIMMFRCSADGKFFAVFKERRCRYCVPIHQNERITAHSSRGVLEFDSVTGAVIRVFPNRPGEVSYLDMIERIDVEEYRNFYGREVPDQVNVLDVAHVLIGGEYVQAEPEFRRREKQEAV